MTTEQTATTEEDHELVTKVASGLFLYIFFFSSNEKQMNEYLCEFR